MRSIYWTLVILAAVQSVPAFADEAADKAAALPHPMRPGIPYISPEQAAQNKMRWGKVKSICAKRRVTCSFDEKTGESHLVQ